MSLYLIEDAGGIWHVVEPMLKRAIDLDAGRSTTETVKKNLQEGNFTLWVYEDLSLVIVTSIEEYETGIRSCMIRLCAGSDLDKCRESERVLSMYAKEMGCDMVEINGRPGWIRMFPDYKKDAVIIRKDI